MTRPTTVSEAWAINKRNVRGGRKMFHKNHITLTVLSEEPISERMELGDIIRECDEGAFVLYTLSLEHEEVTAREMAVSLYEAGSDPGFFNLDHLDVQQVAAQEVERGN